MNAKLSDIQEMLADGTFVRIHQSYLVNLRFIKDVSNYQVTLWNGNTLPIARPKYKDIREKYLLYEGEF